MKKRIFSILLGICLVFSGLMSFSGCSIYTKDNEKTNASVVMKIGDTEVTKSDLYSAFYTYYQNNSTYFAYYSEELIEESFYTWFVVKTLVSELSYKALYDETTNPNGYIYYTHEDADEVWDYVEDYFYSQVSSYEKTFYDDENDYPEWLQDDEEDEEETTKFESYERATKDIELKNRKSDVDKKLSDKDVYGKISDLKISLFRYTVGDDETPKDMGEKGDAVYNKRELGFRKYMEALKLNAKSSGNNSSEEELFKAEVLRIYNAYYDSQINVIFQNYYMQEYLLNYDGAGDKTSLSDKAVVAKFLDEYYKEQQVNKVYDAYVSTMEDDDGASLVLYHYQGRNYYFSVQHILLAFDEDLSSQFGTDSDDPDQHDVYVGVRNEIANANKYAILVEVDETREKNTLVSVCDYYYYDETKKDVYDVGNNIFNGYIKLTNHTVDGNGKITYTEILHADLVDGEGNQITWESENVPNIKRMANIDDVLKAYEETYKLWTKYATEVYNETSTIDAICSAEEDKLEDLRYVLEVAQNYKDCGLSLSELKSKISSLAFIELEWIYSGDSLANEMSNKIGYIVHSADDEDLNWVNEFADGARKILANMKSSTSSYASLQEDEKMIYTETYITSYGYHIIKIENVYDEDNYSIIDLSSVGETINLDENSAYVQKVASLLKKTYVCSSSNETLYDHFYDEVYNALVGTSSSSGTYFLGLEYEWLNKYYKDSKIEITTKLTYDELLASLS